MGSALFDEVHRRLREAGITELAVTTTTTNDAAHRFYRARGMRPVFDVLVGRIDGS